MGRVLFPGVEVKGLRKLQSLLRSWLPKKTEDGCVVLVGGESKNGKQRCSENKHLTFVLL